MVDYRQVNRADGIYPLNPCFNETPATVRFNGIHDWLPSQVTYVRDVTRVPLFTNPYTMKQRIKRIEKASVDSGRRLRKINPATVSYVPVDRSVRIFRDGATERPHRRRGTSTDPEAFGRAYVCKATGSGPEQKRDSRHPDLKRPKAIRANTEPGVGRKKDSRPIFTRTAGLPNTVTSKHADGVCDAPKA